MRTFRLAITALLGTLLACSISGLAAAEPEPATDAGMDSGMRVYVDPETGERVSQPVTADQRNAAASDAAFSENSSRVTEAKAVDGSRMIILNGEFENALVVEVDPQGERSVHCTDAEHADHGDHAHSNVSDDSNER